MPRRSGCEPRPCRGRRRAPSPRERRHEPLPQVPATRARARASSASMPARVAGRPAAPRRSRPRHGRPPRTSARRGSRPAQAERGRAGPRLGSQSVIDVRLGQRAPRERGRARLVTRVLQDPCQRDHRPGAPPPFGCRRWRGRRPQIGPDRQGRVFSPRPAADSLRYSNRSQPVNVQFLRRDLGRWTMSRPGPQSTAPRP